MAKTKKLATETKIAIATSVIAVAFASIAALAASIQAYVSWESRNDVFKAAMLQNVAQQCAEMYVAGSNFQIFLRKLISVAEKENKGLDDVFAKAGYKIDDYEAKAKSFFDKVYALNMLLPQLNLNALNLQSPNSGPEKAILAERLKDSLSLFTEALNATTH